MLVKINGTNLIDEQEKLFQEIQRNFAQMISEYQKKYWFKEIIWDLTGGEDLIDTDKIRAKLWYWKLVLSLRALRILLAISPPSKEQAEEMIEVLEGLKERLEVD